MKNISHYLIVAAATLTMLTACSDGESYSDRLNSERNACNAYLAGHKVINEIPSDTVFITGEDAPFYRIESDGQVYMQVVRAGDRKNDRAKDGETIYFRFTRCNLENWYSTGVLEVNTSNEDDLSQEATYFNYKDFTLPVSSQWGYGIQLPLNYLGVECEVNLVIKSQFGFTSELSYVMPFLYHVRYFHSQI
ncbi:MAG: DUF4827 family protein [Muribaculaceae bacterium]|nr:DUF4827 family protein [Muribaculaceae bacterium]